MPNKSCNYRTLMAIVALFMCVASPGFSRPGGGASSGGSAIGGGSHPTWGSGHTSTPAQGHTMGTPTHTPAAITHTPVTTTHQTQWGKGPAAQQHPHFTSRGEAIRDFRSNYGSQYPLHFTSEPAVRPAYIPHSFLVRNQHVLIVYNQQHGGYGYIDPLTHAWVMYDLWVDQAMMNHMMVANGYPNYSVVTVHHVHTHSWSTLILMLLVGILIIVVIVHLASNCRTAS